MILVNSAARAAPTANRMTRSNFEFIRLKNRVFLSGLFCFVYGFCVRPQPMTTLGGDQGCLQSSPPRSFQQIGTVANPASFKRRPGLAGLGGPPSGPHPLLLRFPPSRCARVNDTRTGFACFRYSCLLYFCWI